MRLARKDDVICSDFQQQFLCCLSLFFCTRTAASFVYHIPLFHKALPRSCCPWHYAFVDRNLLGTITRSLCCRAVSEALLLGGRAEANASLACPCLQSMLHHPRGATIWCFAELLTYFGFFLVDAPSVDPNDQKKTACYDIDVEVDDTLKTQMNSFLLSTASQQEIAALDNKVGIAPPGLPSSVLGGDVSLEQGSPEQDRSSALLRCAFGSWSGVKRAYKQVALPGSVILKQMVSGKISYIWSRELGIGNPV